MRQYAPVCFALIVGVVAFGLIVDFLGDLIIRIALQ